MSIWNVINLAGGLAMFIFGMNLMSDGLKLVAGSYLKKILEKLTQNRIIAMVVGAGLTALIQSSNAMCVMVVGFVNAGMMQLERSVGILMGAKIGTTITGQLIAFNISEIAPVIAFVGVAITMFSKKPKVKNVGKIMGDQNRRLPTASDDRTDVITDREPCLIIQSRKRFVKQQKVRF